MSDMIVLVPTRRMGAVIGAKGSKIKSIHADSGADIVVLDKNSVDVDTRVRIRGTDAQIATAKALIEETIKPTRVRVL